MQNNYKEWTDKELLNYLRKNRQDEEGWHEYMSRLSGQKRPTFSADLPIEPILQQKIQELENKK